MKVDIKLRSALYAEIMDDLARPHPFAWERVGFVIGRVGSLANGGKLVLLHRYHSIPDDQYMKDETVGARIGSDAITWAMQATYYGRGTRDGIFHVHVHAHEGETRMSGTDSRETPRLIPGFQSVGREAAHGILILTKDHGSGWVWLPGQKQPTVAGMVSVIGAPVGLFERGARR